MGFHLPFFPLYAAETLADGRFQSWNLEERGAWITLLAHAWNDLDIPDGHSALARLLRVEGGDMARIWSAIGDRFAPAPGKDGRLVCPRLEDERDRATALSRHRAEAGRKGATSRWSKRKTPHNKRMRLLEQTDSEAMRPQCDTNGRIQSQSQSQSPEAAAARETPKPEEQPGPARVRPLAIHLAASCPSLAALLTAAPFGIEPGRSATTWGAAETLITQAGGSAAALAVVAEAAPRSRGYPDAVPISFVTRVLLDATKQRANGVPKPTRGMVSAAGQDYSKPPF